MKVKGWKYYNHAAVPTTSPHEKVDTSAIENGQVWKIGGGARSWHVGLQTLIAGMRRTGGM